MIQGRAGGQTGSCGESRHPDYGVGKAAAAEAASPGSLWWVTGGSHRVAPLLASLLLLLQRSLLSVLSRRFLTRLGSDKSLHHHYSHHLNLFLFLREWSGCSAAPPTGGCRACSRSTGCPRHPRHKHRCLGQGKTTCLSCLRMSNNTW